MSCALSDGIEHQSETTDESLARRVTAVAKQPQTRRGCTSSSSALSQYSIDVIDSMTLETIDDPMTRSFYSSVESEGTQLCIQISSYVFKYWSLPSDFLFLVGALTLREKWPSIIVANFHYVFQEMESIFCENPKEWSK